VSDEHVTQVFGPPWIRRRVELLEQPWQESERIILTLRRRLRAADPSLPNVCDGKAWQEIETSER
jgi:hypothetical protein